MAVTPEPLPRTNAVDFRAPPPSPVAPGRQSPFANDDVLSEYLQQSLKVPDLVLPDRVFPCQKSVQNPPRIDFGKLGSFESEMGFKICDLIAQVGCLELINHGISPDLMGLVLFLAGGIFQIPPEKKKTAARSPERRYGFEEIHGEEEIRDQSEEFLWCDETTMKSEMEGIWPFGFSNFSQEMKKLSRQMEEVGRRIMLFLEQHSLKKFSAENGLPEEQESAGKVWCIEKHGRKMGGDHSLRYDVIRMLIKGSEFSHALSLHLWSGTTDFHVYSKKGWVSFFPARNSIVVTIGDKLQGWSGGQYKHVIGRPVFKGENEKSNISMAFLYSPPKFTNSTKQDDDFTISITQQFILCVLITFVYRFLISIYHFFCIKVFK
ncbi:LOW QUALITY PROTEIN: gibberellin 3-beta-dioxygenase 4 [Salvia miltiorrhiza]|uniref:LOW QUALITY PROTEIN: gibberellin 3-beta-dioxygenase 4 n=1 Tax=Salvia miltiorrhiza TaxID=226208 RepID=UPI0025AC661B|nr:LOW QUALITY PROTEIN: gibberellin 3-beta-dioxygenase 4 [Salvia miltiorrhiza]